jgi:type IV pilus assembly protein PilM
MSALASRLSLQAAPPPAAAVEIAAHHVAAAEVEFRGGRPVVGAHAAESLPPGALVPALAAFNVQQRAAVVGALSRVLERIGRPRRVGLVIPDAAARVSLLRFEQVPARAPDLDQLVRWQVRKAAPFPIEQAQVSYVRGYRAPDGQDFVVTLARRDVVEEYEGLCAAAGAYAGLVDISTFNVINAVLASGAPGADWLLVNVAFDAASIAIMRGADLVFFRSRGADGDETLADLVHQTAMYYEDRLQGAGLTRVLVSGASSAAADVGEAEGLRRMVEERLRLPVEVFDARGVASLTDRIMAAPALLDALTPLMGMLLRGREAA